MITFEVNDNVAYIEDAEFVGSGATLDLAVADAYDRAMTAIPSHLNWKYSGFSFNLTLVTITVSGTGGAYCYDRNSAPDVTATFKLKATVKL